MPRKNIAGTFEGTPYFRWKKMVRGKIYVLLCRGRKPGEEKERTGWLDLPETDWTKERSQAAANRWWESRLSEITAPKSDPEKEKALQDIESKLTWATGNMPSLVPELKRVKQEIKSQPPSELALPDDDAINKNLEIAKMFDIAVPDDVDPLILQHLFGDKRVWAERFLAAKEVSADLTLERQIATFLTQERQRLKPQSLKELSDYLELLSADFGKQFDCSTISERTVLEHYNRLAAKPLSAGRKNKLLGFFRRFVAWLWSTRVLKELPRNLKLRAHRFVAVPSEIATFENVKAELNQLAEQPRLWALLGLNCGMTQADLGALTWNMIDLKRGTLTRKRVKTESQKRVPVVRYKLFPETRKLLAKMARGSKPSGLVFMNQAGGPMYETRVELTGEGLKCRKKDLFSTYWGRQTRQPKIPLGKYRSIGSTALKKDGRFRDFVPYFLGHAPRSTADRSYAAEADEVFFEALDFVRAVTLT